MLNLLRTLILDDQGQDLIVYALLAGFVSLATVAAVTSVGTSLNTVYGSIATKAAAAK
jgi:pilus assembly protein Flp/PilA